MRIVLLWGMDYSNVLDSADGVHAVYVITPTAEALYPKHKQLKLNKRLGNRALGVSYCQDELAETISLIAPDVIISMGWRRVLSESFLFKFQDKVVVNVHPAILPQYKGYHTEPYVIINAESEHGITAHLMTDGLDDGDIIHQTKFPVSNFSTTRSIKHQAHAHMPVFIEELVRLLSNNDFQRTPQDPSLTKMIAPRRNPDDSLLDPTRSLEQLYNVIRACDVDLFPAFFYVDGQKVFVTIRRAQDAPRENEFDI